MTESNSPLPDPLEAELNALRPREASPELRARIAARMAGPPRTRLPWFWQVGLVGGALAAAGLAAILLSRIDRAMNAEQAEVQPPVVPQSPAPVPDVEPQTILPTVLVYSRALAGPSEELNALFDQHARLGTQPDSDETHVFAFTRPDDTLHPISGEL